MRSTAACSAWRRCRSRRRCADRGGCWFRTGLQELHVGVEDPFAPGGEGAPEPGVVDDLDALSRAAPKASGIAVRDDDTIPGLRRFYAADPFRQPARVPPGCLKPFKEHQACSRASSSANTCSPSPPRLPRTPGPEPPTPSTSAEAPRAASHPPTFTPPRRHPGRPWRKRPSKPPPAASPRGLAPGGGRHQSRQPRRAVVRHNRKSPRPAASTPPKSSRPTSRLLREARHRQHQHRSDRRAARPDAGILARVARLDRAPGPAARLRLHARGGRGQPPRPRNAARTACATAPAARPATDDRWPNSTRSPSSGCAAMGIARYEISNFARPGIESLHNLKYWLLEPYIGFGADAHSFDGRRRWSNVEIAGRVRRALAAGHTAAVERRRLRRKRNSSSGCV